MREDKLPPRDAAIKAMREVTGPIIAIVLTLTAVFVPIAFLGGLTGELYRQFAVTISIAVVISGLVALTLSPALCVLILKHARARPSAASSPWFNRWFARVTHRYTDGVLWMIRRGMRRRRCCSSAWSRSPPGCGAITPGSLVPDEDQGFYIAAVILPDGATLERTDKVVKQVEEAIRANPANQDIIAFTGLRLHRRRLPQQRRDDLRHADALGRAQGHRGAARRRALRQDDGHQGSAGARVQPAADLRPRHRGRLRVLHPEPRRRRRQAAARGHAGSSSRARTSDQELGGAQTLWRATCRSSSSTSTARRRRSSACRSTTCSTRCRRRSAPTTSTTSTSTAARGRC